MCYCYFYVHEIYNPVHYTIIHTFVILHQTTICKIRQLMCAKINSFLQKSLHNYIINNNEIIQINVKTADIFGELISLLISSKKKIYWTLGSIITYTFTHDQNIKFFGLKSFLVRDVRPKTEIYLLEEC